MKELAELAYSYGGWWIWIIVYRKNFTVTHYPQDGICSVRMDPGQSALEEMVSTVMELAEYVRKFCPDAPESSDQILLDVKEAIKVTLLNEGGN